MKVGDTVMFKPEGRYAKWFGGKIAVVERARINSKGELHLAVAWLHPVPYFDSLARHSHFKATNFISVENKQEISCDPLPSVVNYICKENK